MNSEAGNDKYLQEDLDGIAASRIVTDNPDRFLGASVLVTGATGLIGSLLVKSFAAISRENDLHMTIFPVIRSREKAARVYGEEFLQREDVRLIEADVTEQGFVEDVMRQAGSDSGHRIDATDRRGLSPETAESPNLDEGSDPSANLAVAKAPARGDITNVSAGGEEPPADISINYIFHAAAVTTSKVMVTHPIGTIDAAITGTKNLLELAAAALTKSFVYISSMEVYGDMSVYGSDPEATMARENRLGFIDPMVVRSNYPESKRMCENLCAAYLSEKGVPAKIARLAQTFGAGILPWEKRVFAQFAAAAMTGEDIVLHTKGCSEGNYCYSADCMRGLLTILLNGADGEAYNVANEACHTTIAGMAQLVAETIAGGKIRVAFDIPETNTYGYAADTKLTLDSTKLRQLGWQPEVGLAEMYRRTIGSMECRQRA